MPNEMTAGEAAENLEEQDKYPVTRLLKDREALRLAASVLRRVESGKLVEVVHCKDCKYWKDRKIELPDGKERDYKPDEPWLVSSEVGINIGSHCMVHGVEDDSSTWFWSNENDFCSWGKRKE